MVRKLLYSATGLAAALIGNAIIFLIIARSVNVANFGIFAKTYVTASLLCLLVDFGYPQRILRDLPQYAERFGGLPARVLHLKALLAILLSIAAAPLGLALDLEPVLFAILWIGLLMTSFGHVGGVVLRASERHGADGRNLLTANLLGVVCAVALMISGVATILPFASVFVVTGGAYLVLSGISARRRIRLVGERFERGAVAEEFRRGISYASDVLVVRAYGFADVLILSLFSGPVGVGLYQLGQKLMQIMLPTAQVITNVMLPRLSRKNAAGALALGDLGMLTLAIGGFGLAMGIVFHQFAGLAIDWLLTPGYGPVKALVPIFALTIGARIASVAPSIWLVAAGRQRERLVMNSLNLAIFLALCTVLSARGGAAGTALATAISAVLWMTMYYSVAIAGYFRKRPAA